MHQQIKPLKKAQRAHNVHFTMQIILQLKEKT